MTANPSFFKYSVKISPEELTIDFGSAFYEIRQVCFTNLCFYSIFRDNESVRNLTMCNSFYFKLAPSIHFFPFFFTIARAGGSNKAQ